MSRILITGCGSGIGRAAARHLTGAGHQVIATARDPDSIADLHCTAKLALDVTDDASVRAATAGAGEIDVLVNNAGISVWGAAELIPMASAERIVQTNFLGVVRMTQAVLPQMRERRRGLIVQISSTAVRRPGALMSLYASSKAAVDAYSFAVRQEMWGFGVQVTVLGMTAIDTNFAQNRETVPIGDSPYADMAARARARAERAKGEPKDPAEVAREIERLIADERPPYRTYVGEDGRRLVAELECKDDATLDREMLQALHGG